MWAAFLGSFRLSPADRLTRLDPGPPPVPSPPFVGYKRAVLWVGFSPSDGSARVLSAPSKAFASESRRFGPFDHLSALDDALEVVLSGGSPTHTPLFRFRGLAHPVSYDVVDAARCARSAFDDPSHLPPQEGCSCGFYALLSRSRIAGLQFSGAAASPHVSSVLLEVAAFGDVVVAETGLRFSHQQVRRVELEPWCSFCGRAARTVGVSLSPLEGSVAPVYPVVSACRRHVPRLAAELSPAQLESHLGVPVTFGDQLPASAIWGVSPEVRFFERLSGKLFGSRMSPLSYNLLAVTAGPRAWYPPSWVWRLSRRLRRVPPRMLYRIVRVLVWVGLLAGPAAAFLVA